MSRVYVHVMMTKGGDATIASVRLEQTVGAALRECITSPLYLSGAGTGMKGGSQYAIQSLGDVLPYLSLPFCTYLITRIVALLSRLAETHPDTSLEVGYVIPADAPTATGTMTIDQASQDALLATLLAANPDEPILLELRQAE
ncbi:hypothetical protein [Herpetosiphon giganteus]|uniref:hypothetical protein n=1 Tax=Herpetosiphon giganteus TaxID=2029754 RepID=UPI00195ED57D|nr:hypothetical protein [Herpetosiphon giganteus]MBM7845931.1 hypothetical protein [Herpetosiphon giganteus]